MFAIPFRIFMFIVALFTGLLTSYSVFSQEAGEPYDRLDGTGESHKKVDVIEWEGNLEVHIAPKGSTKGFSAKLDDREQGKKVMVIGYRFEGMKKPLVRRAILGIPFNAKLKAFIDPTEKDYDKLALSNKDLPKPFVPYKMETAPAQWYPDGDPRNDDDTAPADKPVITEKNGPVAPAAKQQRAPASTGDSDNDLNSHYNW